MGETRLPQDNQRRKTGRAAAEAFKLWCTHHDLIFRDVPAEEDFGVDGEIELKAGSTVTGLLVKAQVKGRNGVPFAKSETAVHRESVKPSTFRYWASLPLNILGVLVDVSTHEMYWTSPRFLSRDPELAFCGTPARLGVTPGSGC